MKPKKIISLLVCILLLAILAACARQDPQEAEPTPSPEPSDTLQGEGSDVYEEYQGDLNEPPTMFLPESEGIHGLISVVEHGNNRVYILGSMHLGRPEWYPLAPAVESAMNSADVFAFEIDLTTEGGPCLCDPDYCDCGCEPGANDCICFIESLFFFPDGTYLSTFLPPEDYEIFMAYLSTFPVNPEIFETMRPTTIAEMIMYHIMAPMMGLSAYFSIDSYVLSRAADLGRPIIGLTEIDDHIAFLAGMPDEYQIATARYFSDFDTMWTEMEELAFIYEIQDIATLSQMVDNDLEQAYAAYAAGELSAGGLGLARYWHHTVGNYRSAFFARQIADLLIQTEEPTIFFVTVGIAHLARELNVFDTLREMGFDVVGLY